MTSTRVLLEHHEWVLHLARVLSRDPAAADDLAQDTWVRALERPPSHDGALRAWLGTIVRNLARNRIRGDGRRRCRERGATGPAAFPDPSFLVARAEAHARVVDVVVALDEPYRTTVLAYYFEGAPLRDVAVRTGVSHDAAKKRLQRAHALLRRALDDEYGDDEHGGDRRAWLAPLLLWDGSTQSGDAPAIAQRPLARIAAVMGASVLLGTLLVATWGVFGPVLFDDEKGATAVETDGSASRDAGADGHAIDRVRTRHSGKTTARDDVTTPRFDTARADPSAWSVRVIDAEGAPLAGVSVKAYVMPRVTAYTDFNALRLLSREIPDADATATSDAHGDARITFHPGKNTLIVARRPGYAQAMISLRGRRRADGGPDVTLELGEPHVLRGRVIDDLGVGRVGLTVHAEGILDDAVVFWPGRRVVTTGSGGAFEFTDLPAGDWGVGIGDEETQRFRIVAVALPDPTPVVIRLPRGCTISGTVTDASSGIPLAGVSMHFGVMGEPGPQAAAMVVTDSRGHYVHRSLFGGRVVRATAARPGYLREQLVTFGVGSAVQADVGGVLTLDASLRRGGTVRGRVMRAGEPVVGAAISATRPSGRWPPSFGAETDADGRYEFTALPAERITFSVRPREPEMVRVWFVPTSGDAAREIVAGADPLELDFEEAHDRVEFVAVEGRVVDAAGAPISAAIVGDASQPPSGDDGRFEIKLARSEKPRRMAVHRDGYTWRFVDVETISGDRVRLGDVVLRRPARLRGRVVDATGAPVGGAFVWIGEYRENVSASIWIGAPYGDHAPLGPYRQISDGDGRFALQSSMPEGRLAVRARAPGYATGESEWFRHPGAPAEPEVEVVLNTPETAAGVVRNERTGETVRGARVLILSAQQMRQSAIGSLRQGLQPARARTDGSGSYAIEGLDPGAYVVGAVADGFLGADVDVTLPHDGPIEIRLEPLFTLGGIVVDVAGRPFAECVVRVLSFKTQPFTNFDIKTDLNGEFRAEGLRFADYRIVVPGVGWSAELVEAGSSDTRIVIEPFPDEDDEDE